MGNYVLSESNHSSTVLLPSQQMHSNQQQSPSTPALPLNSPPQPQLTEHPDFASMDLAEILPLNLTICELVDFNLLGRFMATHNGSRYVQSIISSIDARLLSVLVRYLVRHSASLLWQISTSKAGNYFVQKLFEMLSVLGADEFDPEAFSQLHEAFLFPSALELSTVQYGSRVVQSALKHSSHTQRQEFVAHYRAQCAAAQRVPLMCLNASHTLQAMLQLRLPLEEVSFIQHAMECDLEQVSSSVSGCRVVQCFVTTYPNALDVAKMLKKRLHLRLSLCQYGNYVVQCVASKMPAFSAKLIVDVFRARNLYRLGTSKQGSNVLEKCVRLADKQQLAMMISRLTQKRASLLTQLAWDEFGNYAISTLLDCCGAEQRREVVCAMHEHVVDLSTGAYATGQSYGHSAELVHKCRAMYRMRSASYSRTGVYAREKTGKARRSRKNRFGGRNSKSHAKR